MTTLVVGIILGFILGLMITALRRIEVHLRLIAEVMEWHRDWKIRGGR